MYKHIESDICNSVSTPEPYTLDRYVLLHNHITLYYVIAVGVTMFSNVLHAAHGHRDIIRGHFLSVTHVMIL